jgi:hypothetical protein
MNPYFIADAILMYSLLGLSLYDARKRGWHVVWQVLAGVLFGVMLEWATIQQLHAYQYGRFPIMIAGEVPLAIGVGWGVIIYASRRYADATSLPRWAKPLLAALLALNIDLSMDAIAIRLGMWNWGQGLDFQYFGVPWANFWAWFWVVAFFSAGLWWLSDGKSALSRWLGPAGALLLGVAGVLATNYFIVYVGPRPWYKVTIALALLGALGWVLLLRPHIIRPLPPISKWTPFTFHAFFLLAGIVSGVIFQPPVLLVVSLIMFEIAWLLHRRPASALANNRE